MMKTWQKVLDNSIEALLTAKDEAIVYFTRRDLLGEEVGPINRVWSLAVCRRILKKQASDGSWAGPINKNPVFPENHAFLVASFKELRTLIEKYQFNLESAPIEKAAEYIFKFQTLDGDIRGFIGNQYATYYTGCVLALLIKVGYSEDPRVEKGMQWLLKMRQDDGGWTIPILTHHLDGKTMYRLTSSYAEPVEPDRTQPFSHNWTDMVLRAFAAHPGYRQTEEARIAGDLLKSSIFKPDFYSSYKAAAYWTRFIHWWPNLLTAMESLSRLGYTADDPDIYTGLKWFFDNVKEDGLWESSYEGKSIPRSQGYSLERSWTSLRICRMLKRYIS